MNFLVSFNADCSTFLEVMLQWWQMFKKTKMKIEDESWSSGRKQQIPLPFKLHDKTANYSSSIKTNTFFLNLRDSMWALNKVVINVFPRVKELVCKLLLKHRIPVYNCCVGNRVPRAPPCVLTLNELSCWLLSENLRPPPRLPLNFLLLSAFPVFIVLLFPHPTRETCLLSITLLLVSFYAFVFCSA